MFTYNDLLSKTIDIQGFSHQSRQHFEAAHAAMPNKPLWASECCSCNTQRGEMRSGNGLQQAFNADCQQGQTNATDGVAWAVGTTVWTLFDYYGEPSNGGWPYVSSTFGAFDLAGFAKAGAHWFRSQWLFGVPDSSYDKQFATGAEELLHIVEPWTALPPPPPPGPPSNTTTAAACLSAQSRFVERQAIVLRPAAHGTVSIVSATGLCVDGSNGGRCNSSFPHGGCYPLPFRTCETGTPGQMFNVSAATGLLQNVGNGGCLDLNAGSGPDVGIWECSAGNNDQKWSADHGPPWTLSVVNSHGQRLCLGSGQVPSVTPPARTVHVYTSAPTVELIANGVSQGRASVRRGTLGGPSWAEFSVPYAPGNVTALALSSANATVASQTYSTPGAPAALELTLDAPSAKTGTGTALLLDGQDVALVRATVRDAQGRFCSQASGINVTFTVSSGPGRIFGAHSGDPASHEPNQQPWHSSYHGLVRGVVQVTSDAAAADRALRHFVDVDAPPSSAEAGAIVIQAHAPGLATATVTIPTSTNAATDSVLAAASKYGSGIAVEFD